MNICLQNYNVELAETSLAGSILIQVHADDKDIGDYGDIRYTLSGEPNVFSINYESVSY